MLRPDYPLRTERLDLRPFTTGDLDDLYAIQRLPQVARYLYWQPRSREQVREALRRSAAQHTLTDEGQNLSLAVRLHGQDRVIGQVNVAWLSRASRQGEIGFAFHPDVHGRGLAAEAANLLLALAFEGLGLHRVIGRCEARNTASAALMGRLGMRREAHLVENEWVKGEWNDELVYAILDREWAARSPT